VCQGVDTIRALETSGRDILVANRLEAAGVGAASSPRQSQLLLPDHDSGVVELGDSRLALGQLGYPSTHGANPS
jgi:hypothetical protein